VRELGYPSREARFMNHGHGWLAGRRVPSSAYPFRSRPPSFCHCPGSSVAASPAQSASVRARYFQEEPLPGKVTITGPRRPRTVGARRKEAHGCTHYLGRLLSSQQPSFSGSAPCCYGPPFPTSIGAFWNSGDNGPIAALRLRRGCVCCTVHSSFWSLCSRLRRIWCGWSKH
jgi:hypothetical protein